MLWINITINHADSRAVYQASNTIICDFDVMNNTNSISIAHILCNVWSEGVLSINYSFMIDMKPIGKRYLQTARSQHE
ncbi:hypothetical protein AL552_07135 [Vibrio diabolicus]|nr:hypothetical protein AL552_07135 [Vibrio diabolicus]OKQ17008.1 hypothetical protein H058_05260 [Vibrio antiquarius]